MNVYRVCWQNNEAGWVVSWAGSKRQAKAQFRDAAEAAKHNGESVSDMLLEKISVKCTKQGLLHFLNNRTPATDNG